MALVDPRRVATGRPARPAATSAQRLEFRQRFSRSVLGRSVRSRLEARGAKLAPPGDRWRRGRRVRAPDGQQRGEQGGAHPTGGGSGGAATLDQGRASHEPGGAPARGSRPRRWLARLGDPLLLLESGRGGRPTPGHRAARRSPVARRGLPRRSGRWHPGRGREKTKTDEFQGSSSTACEMATRAIPVSGSQFLERVSGQGVDVVRCDRNGGQRGSATLLGRAALVAEHGGRGKKASGLRGRRVRRALRRGGRLSGSC